MLMRITSRRLLSAAANGAASETSSASSSISQSAKTSSSARQSKISDITKAPTSPTAASAATPLEKHAGKTSKPVIPEKHRVHIPTTPPAGTVIAGVRSGTKDGISNLKDYQHHFSELLDIFVPKKYFPPTDPRHVVLTQMVDAFSLNPTFPMAEKKRAIQLAVDLLRNQKIDLTVQALKGTQQAKSPLKGN